ncbi:cytochrome-c peroxidase [Segetibacter sp. 3557_3]|uniref:cytochrome-c peroxidase n=1 Tax=Segetibacter sp. 3557_3 TaxID=2547429 RepID=UPI0010584C95|nr:cytochrome c peroxidase [Segetibacter sp. 3557_3]TDH27922.1 cytochrome-c peroxidase [Segetibacter sp. 3557_3]
MQKVISTILVLVVLTGILAIDACKKKDVQSPAAATTPLNFTVPAGWPQPKYRFDSNQLTKEGFELGKKLFYDGRLSKDGNFPCGSCHQQFAAFATFDHDLSHGFNNTLTTRNSPGLANLAWQSEFMWDGGINHLDLQPLAPITAPNEMAETISGVIGKLQSDPVYRGMFKAAFGTEQVNTQRMTRALSQFILMMVSNNSKYDKVKRGEATFTLSEGLGYEIFKAKCAGCHAEPLFTDQSYRNVGLPVNNSIKDFGRMLITRNPADSLKFKVPTLRNVELSFPYEHDGRFYYLDNVLEHYRNGVVNGPTTDPLVRGKIPLSNFEIGQLKSFLFALTDSTFLKDKRFSE